MLSSTLRPVARAALGRRLYAEAAPAASKSLKLSLVLPHQSIFTSSDVTQVSIPAESGSMGILAGHVPTIENLKPGIVEVIESAGSSKKFFISGGFAAVHPNNTCTINAVEGYDVSDFDLSVIRNNLASAKQTASSSSSSEIAKAEAQIAVDVLTILEANVKA